MIELISPLSLIQTLSLHFSYLVLLLVTSLESYAHPLLQSDTPLKPFSCFLPCLLALMASMLLPINFSHLSPLIAFSPVHRIISYL